MKIITINKGNIASVYGKLKKFFCNKKHTGFETFHNFNCGFHNISPMLNCPTYKADTTKEYARVSLSGVVLRPSNVYKGRMVIQVKLSEANSIIFNEGDKVAFLGGCLIHKSKWIGKNIYQYMVIMQKAMPLEKEFALKEKAVRQKKAQEEYWEEQERLRNEKWLSERKEDEERELERDIELLTHCLLINRL